MKFIVDKMLGRLATWLRILGYDTEFYSGRDREGLVLRSLKEDRLIITRDSHITKRHVVRFIFIQSDFIREQVRQLLTASPDLFQVKKEKLFSRCTLCNAPVEPISKEQVKGRVAPFIYDSSTSFSYCPHCDKIYWQGTHWEKLLKDLKSMGVEIEKK